MGLLAAILLGVLQGLTEFLPVSSSGHLRLLGEVFGIEEPQTLFDIMLHVGTLVAVFFVYRALFGRMAMASLRALREPRLFWSDPDARLLVLAIAGTVPTGVIALTLGDLFEGFAASIAFVGAALLVNGVVLLVLGRVSAMRTAQGGRPLEEMSLRDALIVGTVQGFGIVRGISRSGSTITAAMIVGLDQKAAAALSFVLAVPAICGALVLKLGDVGAGGPTVAEYVAGALAAAVVGTVALVLLLRLLDRGRLHHFAWYSFAVGALAVALGLSKGA